MSVKLHRVAAMLGRGAHVTADSLFICFPHETDCQRDPLSRYEKKCNITNACISNILTDSTVGVSGYRLRQRLCQRFGTLHAIFELFYFKDKYSLKLTC
jgi:hypothetical protein